MYSTLFEVFGIPVRAYGLMLVLGFALAIWRATRRAKKIGISTDHVLDLGMALLLSGIFGARLLFVFINPHTESFSRFFAVWEGGLSFQGGVLFAVLAGYVYVRIKKINFAVMADLMSPSLALGYAIARIGCFLNGCCYGAPTDLPWGVKFCENGVMTPPSHPTQIYALIINLFIFWILTKVEKLGKRPGFVFTSYITLYCIYRFLIESLRKGYSAKLFMFGLTEAQFASLIVLAGSLVLLYFLNKPKPASD